MCIVTKFNREPRALRSSRGPSQGASPIPPRPRGTPGPKEPNAPGIRAPRTCPAAEGPLLGPPVRQWPAPWRRRPGARGGSGLPGAATGSGGVALGCPETAPRGIRSPEPGRRGAISACEGAPARRAARCRGARPAEIGVRRPPARGPLVPMAPAAARLPGSQSAPRVPAALSLSGTRPAGGARGSGNHHHRGGGGEGLGTAASISGARPPPGGRRGGPGRGGAAGGGRGSGRGRRAGRRVGRARAAAAREAGRRMQAAGGRGGPAPGGASGAGAGLSWRGGAGAIRGGGLSAEGRGRSGAWAGPGVQRPGEATAAEARRAGLAPRLPSRGRVRASAPPPLPP
jgi:hypothetical protein